MSQFYALMSDNTVKHISLKEEIVTEIKNIFINGGAIFKPEGHYCPVKAGKSVFEIVET